MSSFNKYRIRDVAKDFGMTAKEVSDIVAKYFEKPRSNMQVLEDQQLNVLFEYITQHHQIDSLEQVFAVAPAPKQEPPKKGKPGQTRCRAGRKAAAAGSAGPEAGETGEPAERAPAEAGTPGGGYQRGDRQHGSF